MQMRTLLVAVSFALNLASLAIADTVVLNAARDTTLYEDAGGALGNGAGEHFFAGRTGNGDVRRALIFFDVAGGVPSGSVIDSVQLNLTMNRSVSGPADVQLRRVNAGWGEGASDAPGEEGGGAPAAVGAATWIHRFYDTSLWSVAGGDLGSVARAVTTVDGVGPYTWGTSPEMVADVQEWLDNPSVNFGWAMVGDEGAAGTAKRFGARENADPSARPALVVVYTPAVPTASGIPTTTTWGMLAMVLLIVVFGVRRMLAAA